MVRVFSDNTESIGNTPLIRLNNITHGSKAKVYAKIEGRNPSFSVKCRVGVSMVREAERLGLMKSGKEIIEPTSGNTGIALAFIAAARGYPITLTMPETMSLERRRVLAALGAKLMLTPAEEGVAGAIRRAEIIATSFPERYWLPQQFKNPANPAIHEATTGPEIWQDTNGEIDILVAGVGTGGTISGVSRYIKKTLKKAITSVAVEPLESPVISQYLAGEKISPGKHKIEGIGAGFIPETLDLSLIDRVEQVSSDEAIEFTHLLASKEGIFCGISSGAAVAAAIRLAHLEEFDNKIIVVILPDAGERYLSTGLFNQFGETEKEKL